MRPNASGIVIVSLTLLSCARVASAQHEGHQMGGGSTGDGGCRAHAKESLVLVENANNRLEEARQTNSPQGMRAAMDDLQGALAEVRTHLSLCASPASSSTEGAAMSPMPGASSDMKTMDHSKMGKESSAPKAPAKPEGTGPSSSDMGAMDHSKMGQGKPAAPSATQAEDPVDPVCGMEVGTQATEKATYQGKTYYFCSRADREKFLSDPMKYIKR